MPERTRRDFTPSIDPYQQLASEFVGPGYESLTQQSLYRVESRVAGLDAVSIMRGERCSNSRLLGERSSNPRDQTLIGLTSERKVVAFKTHYGGPRSKYDFNNQDGFYVGVKDRRVVAAIFDGAGGSGNGELAACAGIAGLADSALRKQRNIWDAAEAVDEKVRQAAKGGFAAGVLIDIVTSQEGKKMVDLAWAGDSKAMTMRNGAKLEAGTSTLQNSAQVAVDKGEIEPRDYYNDWRQSSLTSDFGGTKLQLGRKSFQAEEGDILIAGTDGLWDLVSEYEILQLAKQYPLPLDLQFMVYRLAYQRNNAREPFDIQHSADTKVTKKLELGDNITVGVMEL